MKCIYCKGKMIRGTTLFHVDRKGCHLTFDAMPAWICEQCGEPYFDAHDVEAIQDIVISLEQKVQALAAAS